MRQRVIVYGDCQAESLFNLLRRSEFITANLDVSLHFVGNQARDWKTWREDLPGVACVFLQDSLSTNTYPALHVPASRKPRIIRFPGLSFPSLWPFSTAFGGQDAQAERIRAENGPFGLHSDALLGALRPIKDHTARLDAYLQLDGSVCSDAARLIADRDPGRFHYFDVRRLRKMDESYGSNLGRYILQNFRQRRLFHIMSHPNIELIGLIADELFQKFCGRKISLPLLSDDNEYYQVPIHPSFAKALGVTWATPDLTYQVYDEILSLKDYTMRYMKLYG